VETHTVELLEKKELTNDVVELTLSRPQSFSFKAGQFISLHIHVGDDSRWKPYSVYSSPTQKTLSLCIKIVPGGFASSHFSVVEPGHTYTMRGPFGQFQINKNTKKHVFISTGTGIAPLNSMIETISPKHEKTLLHGVRKKEDLLKPEEYEEMDIDYIPVLSREDWEGKTGYVQEYIPIQEETTYYICGLKDLVLETEKLLLNKGISDKHIKYERYS